MGGARRQPGDRDHADARRRPRAGLLAQRRQRIPRRPRRSLRPLQRAARRQLGLLGARLPMPTTNGSAPTGRPDDGTGRRGALDRRQQPLLLGGIDWARDLARLARPPAARPAPTPWSPRTTPTTSPPATAPVAPTSRGSPALPGRHRRAGGGRLPPRLHRPLHALGRPPRRLLPRLGPVTARRLDLLAMVRPDQRLLRARRRDSASACSTLRFVRSPLRNDLTRFLLGRSRVSRGFSSAGRASRWQREGQGFEPPQLHCSDRRAKLPMR